MPHLTSQTISGRREPDSAWPFLGGLAVAVAIIAVCAVLLAWLT